MAKSKQKISTMKELSKVIGISRPTLSRYFQDPSTVHPSTSEKIKKRLTEVDYVYNFIATRQNRKSSGLIGVIIPHYNDLFFTSLLESIECTARNTGYAVITQSSDGSAEGENRAIARLRSMNADGAIIAPLGLETSNEVLQIASADFPIVFVDSRPDQPVPQSDFVGTDNLQSIASVVDFLMQNGDAPAYLGMPKLNTNALERESAYVATVRKMGFEPRFIDTLGVSESWQFEAFGLSVMDTHFNEGRYTTETILCANDRIAIGAIRAANKHRLFTGSADNPGNLRIAGHDDHPLSQFMHPAVTTVGQDIAGIGNASVQLLLERIRGEREEAKMMLFEADLRIRESA